MPAHGVHNLELRYLHIMPMRWVGSLNAFLISRIFPISPTSRVVSLHLLRSVQTHPCLRSHMREPSQAFLLGQQFLRLQTLPTSLKSRMAELGRWPRRSGAYVYMVCDAASITVVVAHRSGLKACPTRSLTLTTSIKL